MSDYETAACANSIAIIGMALRFPGADRPDTFWRNLAGGVESISRFSREALLAEGVPEDLIDDPTYVPAAGCLEDIELFDAALFGIGTREAELMDPQQRLFLTVAREAFEDAGYRPGTCPGRGGVFAGASISTYLLYNLHGLLDASGADLNLAKLVTNDKDYLATLTAHKLDLRGPAVTVQTACSTSLVAVHQACQSLLSMECDTVLAGGVTVRVPHRVGYLNQGGSMLSASGHCRAFDAAADGTVPGSGAGVVLLKRLADARRDGDPVHAVILGSAVNNDGARKMSFTAPSIAGQVDAISQALDVAGVDPRSVGYIEAHGTGTALGDPIEIEALKQAYGAAGAGHPFCALGSVKTNIGHLECAAGVAGLVKTILALKHARLPPSVGFATANPEFDLDAGPVYVNDALRDWPAGATPRRAAVSSFGFGGTNCHVVLEEAPRPVQPPGAQARPRHVLLPISARDSASLLRLGADYTAFLRSSDVPALEAICHTASMGRRHESYRAAVLGDTHADMLRGLAAWAAGETGAGHASLSGRARPPQRQPLRAFLFTGQNVVYPGMGHALYVDEPAFRAAVDACDASFDTMLHRPVASLLCAEADDDAARALLQQPRYGQPALFALEYAIAALWQSWGIVPDCVLGQGLGEYVAATVAGALPLGDALRLVSRRVALMEALRPAAGMAQGLIAEMLQTSHDGRFELLDPMLDALEGEAATLRLGDPTIPMVSTVTGRVWERGEHTPRHWRQHSRAPARFRQGVETLLAMGCRDFIEVGPDPVLCDLGRVIAAAHHDAADCRWLPSLRRGQADRATMLHSLAQLYVGGAEVAWAGLFASAPEPGRVSLPVTPVRGQRHWLAPQVKPDRRRTPGGFAHGLLGVEHGSAAVAAQFENEIGVERYPFLADHAVGSGPIFPATAYMDMAMTASRQVLGGAVALRDVRIVQPLFLGTAGAGVVRHVQTLVYRVSGSRHCRVEIFSRSCADGASGAWLSHATAEATAAPETAGQDVADLEALRVRCTRRIDPAAFYAATSRRGMLYGPAFRLVTEGAVGDGEGLARIETGGAAAAGTINPTMLDACCQAAGLLFLDQPETDNFLPVALARVRLHCALPATVWSACRLTRLDKAGAEVDLSVFDSTGRTLVEIGGMTFRRTKRFAEAAASPELCLYTRTWLAGPPPAGDGPTGGGVWLLLADEGRQADALAVKLRHAGATCVTARPGPCFVAGQQHEFIVNPADPQHFVMLLGETTRIGTLAGIVHLWSLDPQPVHTPPDPLRGAAATLHLAQAVLAAQVHAPLTIVTRNAIRAAPQSDLCNPPQAMVWGFAAALREEHPELPHRLIDLDDCAPVVGADILFRELGVATPDFDAPGLGVAEDRVAWRGGIRLAQRLARRSMPPNPPYRLRAAPTGMLDQMQVEPMDATLPGPGEVRIQVRATGLNFRDVINALGMLPGNAAPLGGECAGVVEAVGDGVDAAWIGRAVVCGAGGCFASHVVSDLRLVTPMPPSLTFEQAAALPIAYATAHHALNDLARLCKGERVLIHAGAGGVGQAAIQIAQACGAEIFATAGSPVKRDFLRAQGVDHVLDSRSLDFASDIVAITGGEGIDVVLNSLSDRFIPESLRLLRAGGRFLEIGKLGIWTAEQMTAASPGVAYHMIALDRLIAGDPDRVAALLTEVMARFASGAWQPPRLQVFDFAEVTDAFRYMQQARHIGKIAVRHPAGRPISPVEDSAYLITGGTGALGLETARWLASRGARHITLAARRPPDKAAESTIGALRSDGVAIMVRQADLSVPEDVAALLAGIRAEGRPLRGIVHAAGVIEDAPVATQSWHAFARVLGPKVAGAWALSRLSEPDPLDFFVLYSSASGYLGGAGQGAYTAANAYLDALAEARVARGLPGLSMAWGPWPVGMTAALSDADRKRMGDMGLASLTTSEYLEVMERCAADGDTCTVAMSVNWTAFLARPGAVRRARRLAGVVADPSGGTPSSTAASPKQGWAEMLEALPPAQRHAALIAQITEQASRALGGTHDAAPDPDASLLELGLDSLMAVELRNALASAAGRRLPATLLFDYPSTARLAAYFAEDIFGWARPAERPGVRPAAPEPAIPSSPEGMSDEMAVATIAAELEKWSARYG